MGAAHDLDASQSPSREQASARHDALSLFRIYGEDELALDGYPFAWKQAYPAEAALFLFGTARVGIKDLVRAEANNRCERCHHPYLVGGVTTTVEIDGKMVQVSPCDDQCTHEGPWFRENFGDGVFGRSETYSDEGEVLYAAWRILTVHHLNGVKADCRWWNLAALCQRDHLAIQGKVRMDRAFILEHSSWFKPHAAGYYAWKYEGRDITREEAFERMDELLAYERLA